MGGQWRVASEFILRNLVFTLSKTGLPCYIQMVKNLPVMQETWVFSLGWEDPLEKGMATH